MESKVRRDSLSLSLSHERRIYCRIRKVAVFSSEKYESIARKGLKSCDDDAIYPPPQICSPKNVSLAAGRCAAMFLKRDPVPPQKNKREACTYANELETTCETHTRS